MLIIALPLLVCILGLVMFLGSKSPDLKRVGEILFFAGALATLFLVAPEVVHVFGGKR